MRSRKNIKQVKNKRSFEVFSVMEEVYNRVWYIKKKERLKNIKKAVSKFKKRINIKVKNLDIAEK